MMIKHKLNGISSNKDEIVGEMSAGGLSSKITFINHLKEETKIRMKNKQNFFLIILFRYKLLLMAILIKVKDCLINIGIFLFNFT